MAERAVESLSRREQHSGPQREVNAEQASSDYQPKGDWDGRAAHVTAKATDRFLDSERSLDVPGVVAAARCEGMVWNTGDPPRRA